MPTFNSQTLIDQLQSDVRRMILQAQQWQQRSDEDLLKNPENGGWSPVQVLQHLNIYSAYYLPAMEKVMSGPSRQQNDNFHSGWIGNWFTNLMAVDEKGKVRTKMKTPANARPAESQQLNAREILDVFLRDQHQLLNLLQIARSVDLGKLRVPVSIYPWMKIKLGDTFRFHIAHQQRHAVQIERALGESN